MKSLGLVIFGVGILLLASGANAGNPDPAAKKTFDKMIAALQSGDRDAFVADGTDDLKKGVTKEVMEALTKDFGARLKKGHQSTYFGQLKQAGYQIHLWKLTFKDDGDDILVRAALKDGKVAGFFLQ